MRPLRHHTVYAMQRWEAHGARATTAPTHTGPRENPPSDEGTVPAHHPAPRNYIPWRPGVESASTGPTAKSISRLATLHTLTPNAAQPRSQLFRLFVTSTTTGPTQPPPMPKDPGHHHRRPKQHQAAPAQITQQPDSISGTLMTSIHLRPGFLLHLHQQLPMQ